VNFVFAGSVLLKQPFFRKQVASELRRAWPKAIITPLEQESAWGAVILARDLDYGYDRLQMSQLEEVSKLLEKYCAAILS